MSATAKHIGLTPRIRCPRILAFSFTPTIWSGSNGMLKMPWRGCLYLGTAGVNKVINGPIPYAPDGMPLIGPMPGVPNAFEACVFTFGIAQGGGAGKVLAEVDH